MTLRVLMVQTPTSHLGAGERVYPLGLSRLAGLTSEGDDVRGLDMNLHPDPWPLLGQTLLEVQPAVVMLSFRNLDPLAGHHASYLSGLRTSARLVRRLTPDARILAGGPGFTLFAERLMQAVPELDGGVIGEGEPAMPYLLAHPWQPQTTPGLIWRSVDGRIRRNRPASPPADMDALPEMDIQRFRPGDYLRGNAYVAAVGIEGKRGCDLGCGYCVYPLLGGCTIRVRKPELIVDEMQRLYNRCGVKLFHFTDAVINRPADHFEAVCREILRRKLDIQWTGFFRENEMSQPLTRLAMDAGLIAVYFSGDALTDEGLALLNKRMTLDDIFRAARITAQCGVLTMCHFLVNLPGQDAVQAARARRTVDRLLEIHGAAGNLGAVIFNTIRLYPGAPLTRKLLRKGLLDPRTDLLYPVYFNPPQWAHQLYELECRCHSAGVFSRLKLDPALEGSRQ
jgi:anaerobic magnesium-protoporphyrin IX monomethyl ester cyclase